MRTMTANESGGAQPAGDRLLTVGEVARLLSVSTRQVWKLRASKRLPPGVKLSRSARWRASDIARFIAELGQPRLDEAR